MLSPVLCLSLLPAFVHVVHVVLHWLANMLAAFSVSLFAFLQYKNYANSFIMLVSQQQYRACCSFKCVFSLTGYIYVDSSYKMPSQVCHIEDARVRHLDLLQGEM